MKDTDRTKEQLLDELLALRQKISQLEISEMECKKELTRLASKYHQLVENPLVGIWQADTNGRFLFINKHLADMSGYSQDELIGMSMLTPIAPELRPWLMERMEKRKAGQISADVVEMDMVRKDGSRYSALVAPGSLYDKEGTFSGSMGVTIDISKRKDAEESLRRAYEGLEKQVEERTKELAESNEKLQEEILERRKSEEELRASKARYKQLVDSASDIIYRTDARGRFTFFNPAAERITKYSREELMGKHYLELARPDCRKDAKRIYTRQFAKKIPNTYYEFPLITKEGKEVWLGQNVQLIMTGDRVEGSQAVARDITERKRAEELQRASAEIVRTIPSGLFIYQYEAPDRLVLLDSNPAAERLTGIKADEWRGKEFDEIWPQARYIGLTDAFLNAAKSRETYESEEIYYKDERFEAVFRARAFHMPGESLGVAFEDITERKRAEASLRESEQKYRAIFETSQDAIVMVDKEGFFDCNGASIEMYGYSSKEDFLRRHPGDLSPPKQPDGRDSLLAANEHIEKAMIEGSDSFQWTHQRMDGTEFLAEILLSRIELKGKRVVQAVVRDITERQKAEEALRASEANYRAIFNAANEGIFIHDIETGEIIDVNRKMCEMFGYAPHEARRLEVGDISAGRPPYTNKDAMQWLEKAVEEGPQVFEWLHKDRSGRLFWAEINLKEAVIGQERHLLAVVRDIDDRKKVEEERKKLEAQLQQAQKMEAIGTLAGGIAHDFNNLLTGIQGNASLILLGIDESHDHYDNLKSIETLVLSGAKLTNQLLGYARKGKYEVKPIDLNQLVVESSETFGRTRKEITIRRELAADLCAVEVDQGQIQQVLFNLYVNAADAMPTGGELLLRTANAAHHEMKGSLYNPKPGNYVLLTVSDTGVGMDEETKRRIFEPFFTTKEMGRGTGLGLASVYGIVKSHGGYIDVESERGKGTTFMVYLQATQEAVEKSAATAAHVVKKGAETILLVDDEEMIRKVGRELLQQMGYKVLLAEGGTEAVEIYRKDRGAVDLVILDMIMPDMNGGEVYDQLKELAPGIRVLLSSGYSIDGQATEILERGCDGFIQKPFNIRQLSQKIREVLDK